MNFLKSIILLYFPLLFSGCLSLPTLQSGKTVGKNNFDVGANISYGQYSQNSILDEEGDFDHQPVVAIGDSYGLNDKMDIGFNFDQTSFIGPSFKYQFLGDQSSKFATSLGVEAGFNVGIFAVGIFANYISTPLYISVHPTESLGMYLTPRYIHTSGHVFAHPNDGEKWGGQTINVFGYSYGFVLGKKHKIALELSNYDHQFFKPTQISLGYIFSFRRKKPNIDHLY